MLVRVIVGPLSLAIIAALKAEAIHLIWMTDTGDFVANGYQSRLSFIFAKCFSYTLLSLLVLLI